MIDSAQPHTPATKQTPARRIVFVAPFGLGQKTTVWARTLPLAQQLVANGYAVTLLIPPWDTPQDSGRTWDDGGVQVINVALRGGMLLVLWQMVRIIDRLRPELVHIVKPRAHAGLVQWLLWQRRRRLGNGPRIVLDVDDWEQAWATINPYPFLVARFLAWQEEWGIRHTDGVTAASHWLVDRVRHHAPTTPVCYLPNGITPPAERLRVVVTSQQILFYSRYVEVSPTWLADFWSALYNLLPAATFVVFGDALQRARPTLYQTTMADRAGDAAAAVQWLAYDPAHVAHLYATSACAIFPSEQTPLHEAKCSVRLATTLLRGLPVVASAVGEQQYYGGDGAATLVPAAATPVQFAQAVRQVLADPQSYRQRQQAATARLLQEYDWTKLGADLARFYQELRS